MCTKRCGKWGKIVLNRLDRECDLIAADTQYKSCDARWFSMVDSSTPDKPFENAVRGSFHKSKLEAFKELCNFLDNNDDCQYLLLDLVEMLLRLCTVSDVV
ncbi:hypothetical protein AVEN_239253-1 [Araneus ventricosus]|uniref:Uncharacterized protein n=1 Tax=Araneus ventricosus TaxID=182803 RepID=A0A4Y2V5C8_ARAVE|nr:hypothetical protein AVEN_98933-1 [Araneus ventricosus]GBO20480.1 hypothetical protein AVEN_262759-1 [Araneus ventricosus]GBO20483.1 hypothetical protein AVEN_43122-1 [Araneus ventricosus]GBO20485.1 hypothetical protein AVEN_239253-1 [Araneus ventricosus]